MTADNIQTDLFAAPPAPFREPEDCVREISFYAMKLLPDGSSTLFDDFEDSGEPDFYDVQVSARLLDGSIEILEEHEDMDLEEANRILCLMTRRYPDAIAN